MSPDDAMRPDDAMSSDETSLQPAIRIAHFVSTFFGG
jgi:hypothetical protein